MEQQDPHPYGRAPSYYDIYEDFDLGGEGVTSAFDNAIDWGKHWDRETNDLITARRQSEDEWNRTHGASVRWLAKRTAQKVTGTMEEPENLPLKKRKLE